jgi:hypothetical protein
MVLVTGSTGYVGGLAGHLCWYALYPVHAAIFRNLVRRVAERARSLAAPGMPAVPEALP